MSLLLPILLAVAARSPAVAAPPALTTWEELCARPAHWLGKPVRIRVQFHGSIEVWNPYLTRFGASRYSAVQAWADEQLPWIKEEFDSPAVRLFLRRGQACDWAFGDAGRGARFEVTAVVREVFLELPWLEVVEVLPLPERIGEGTVIHAVKARELMTARSFALAVSEFDQAITDSLPAHARADLERLRATCRDAVELEKRHRASNPEKP